MLTEPTPRRVTATTDRWSRHAAAAVASSHIVDRPFSHVVIDDAFDAEMYAQMLSHMPPARAFEPFVFGRHRIDLLTRRDRFWDDVSALIVDGVGPALAERFRDHLRPGVDASALRVRECTLVRDTLGYAIGPHSDDPALKALSLICYLPRANERQRGTSIVAPKRGATIEATPYRWHTWDRFDEIETVAFVPNRVLAFAVTPSSFHAVKRSLSWRARHSLQAFLA